MSRFWAAGGSSDESDSDDSSDSSSFYSSDDSDRGGGGGGGGGGGAGNRWADLSDSDSSDDEVRVVKSGKERALETFQIQIKKIRSAMKENNYYNIQVEFDELAKALVKAKQYLKAGVPRPLVRLLCDLEDYIAERLKDKAQFKKLSARQGRALNRMKLTLKKHNKAYQVVMEAYRQNPTVTDDEESSDSESEASASSSSSSSSSSSGSSGKGSDGSDSGSESVS